MKNYLFIVLAMLQLTAKCQFLDSLQVKAGTSGTAASKGYQPLWLEANRFGTITDQQYDFSTHVKITNANRVGAPITMYDTDDKGLYFDYGIDVYNNDHARKTFFEQAFIRARYKNMTLSAGRFEQIIGEVDHDLSSGSLGTSGNALPIPKINFAIDYTNVPLTNGWLQFKGMISHGWMGQDQFIKSAYLHEKNFYLRLGKGKFKLYGGIQHYAVWGGERPGSFTLDNSLSAFLKVFTVQSGDDGSQGNNPLPNRPGDQRGVIEGGAEWEDDNLKVQLNSQTPFDTGQGITPKNIDRLLSLNIINKKEDAIWKKLVLEFIYTKQMNDFYAIQFRESYYNNGVYRTGWEYNDRIIGTPLFINRQRGQDYFSDVKPYDWNAPTNTIQPLSNIISNRVVGGHVGAIFAITENIRSKNMLTYTNNYGNYNDFHFNQHLSQAYTMQEVSWRLPKSQLSLTGTLAYDFGDLSSNFGSMIGLNWQLKN